MLKKSHWNKNLICSLKMKWIKVTWQISVGNKSKSCLEFLQLIHGQLPYRNTIHWVLISYGNPVTFRCDGTRPQKCYLIIDIIIHIIKCMYWYNEILYNINTVLCPVKINNNTIELTVHTFCYWVLDLLCVTNITAFIGTKYPCSVLKNFQIRKTTQRIHISLFTEIMPIV